MRKSYNGWLRCWLANLTSLARFLTVQALLDAVARLEPDVVVLDIAMPVLKGLEAAEGLHQSGSSTKIVFLTVNTNREVVRAALETGAMGYVVKAHLSKDLVLAIKAALAGVGYVSPSVLESKE